MSDEQMPPNTDAQWWLLPEGKKHERMLSVVRAIRTEQEYRKLTDLLHESMYGNSGGTAMAFGRAALPQFMGGQSRLSLNVCRNMVSAVTSKIAAKNKPKPTFLPDGGDYEDRENCEKLEKFVGGVFYESGVYATLTQCFRDMCVTGTGVLRATDEDGEAVLARVKQKQIVVDDDEGADMKPRSMFQRKYVDRLVAIKLWGNGDPIRERLIRDCPRDTEDIESGYRSSADQILVTEGWHLGETKKTKGRWVGAIEGLTLWDLEWEGDFPFAFMRWTEAVEGFWGVGLVEELRGIQAEINKLLQQIQKGHHLIAGHWLVQQGSTLTAQINNDLAAIVKYTGQPPQYQAPAIIAPEVYSHLWQLYAKAFEIAGISQLQATSQKPSGLDSGVALREYNDIQTERFLEVGQAYEEFVVEAARQVIRVAKRIGGKYRVRAIGKGEVTFIDWADITLKNEPTIKVHPTSLLPTTPAGKLEWAQDMINSKAIPAEDVLDIVDFPDTEAYAKRKNAPRRIIERNIGHILKTGEAVSPEPMDNHQLALRLVNEAYAEARLDMVPEAKLQKLRDYLAVTQSYLPKPAPPAPPPMAMGAPPPMDPMGPPPMPAMPVAA